MSTKIGLMSIVLVGLLVSVSFTTSNAGEGTTASPDAANSIGTVLVKAYTFEPVHPTRQTICGWTKATAGSSS